MVLLAETPPALIAGCPALPATPGTTPTRGGCNDSPAVWLGRRAGGGGGTAFTIGVRVAGTGDAGTRGGGGGGSGACAAGVGVSCGGFPVDVSA